MAAGIIANIFIFMFLSKNLEQRVYEDTLKNNVALYL